MFRLRKTFERGTKSGSAKAVLAALAAGCATKYTLEDRRMPFRLLTRTPAFAASKDNSAAEEKAKMEEFLKQEIDNMLAMSKYSHPSMLETIKKTEFSPYATLADVKEEDRRIKYDFKLKTRA